MSFSSLPPEVLVSLLSYVTDLPSKVRLECLSKKFFECSRNADAWRWNRRLDFNDFQSLETLKAYLKRVPEITKIAVGAVHQDPNYNDLYLSELWAHSHKLRVARLTLRGEIHMPCKASYRDLLLPLMSKCRSSLRTINYSCCNLADCELQQIFRQLLNECNALEDVKLHRFLINQNDNVLEQLRGKPLKTVSFTIFNTVPVEQLITLLDSACEHSVESLTITAQQFDLGAFLRSVQPVSVQTLKTFRLLFFNHDVCNVLPLIPSSLPMLEKFEISFFRTFRTPAVKLAKAVGTILNSSSGRKLPLSINITVPFTNEAKSEEFWDALDLLSIWKSGPRERPQFMRRWRREFNEAAVNVCLDAILVQNQ